MMAPSTAEALGREPTIAGVLRTACVALTNELDAQACNLSRVVGQLLVDLVEHSTDGRRIQLGRSYLLPDFPLTQEVVESGEPRCVSLFDPDVDANEADILRELAFDALVMLPLSLDGRCWGLFEVYRAASGTFTAQDVAAATEIVKNTGAALEDLQRRAAAA
jgi:GAF domain-containing protein